MGLFGGDASGDTRSEVRPWEGLRPWFRGWDPSMDQDYWGVGGGDQYIGAIPWLNQSAQNVPQFFSGQTYAGFNPLQQQSFQGQLGYANSLNPTIGNGFQALNRGLDSLDPNKNAALRRTGQLLDQANSMVSDPYADPTMQAWYQAAQRPLNQAYRQTVGGQIAGNAAGAGGLGGSRQGVAEGLASRDFMNATKDLSGGMYGNMFNSALGNQLGAANLYADTYGQGQRMQGAAIGMMPTMMNAGMTPYNIQSNIGGQRQAMSQNQINEDMARHYYNQDAEYNRARDLFGVMSGTPFSSSTTSGPNPNASNPLSGIVGGGLFGAGLNSLPFFSAGGGGAALGSALGGWALPALGAGLGLLGI